MSVMDLLQDILQGFVPEHIEILLLDVRKCEQGGIVKPSGLNDHLYEAANAQRRHQPSFIRHHIQHSLQREHQHIH